MPTTVADTKLNKASDGLFHSAAKPISEEKKPHDPKSQEPKINKSLVLFLAVRIVTG